MITKQTSYSVAFSFNLNKDKLYIYGISDEIDDTFIYITDNGKLGFEQAFTLDIPSLKPFSSNSIPFLAKGFILNGNNINIGVVDYLNCILYGKVAELERELKSKIMQAPSLPPMDILDYNKYFALQTKLPFYQYLVHYVNPELNTVEYYIYSSNTEVSNNIFIGLTQKTYKSSINEKIHNPKTNTSIKKLVKIVNPSYKKKGGIYAFRLADEYKSVLNIPQNISLYYNRMNGVNNIVNMFKLVANDNFQLSEAQVTTLDAYYSTYQFTII